MSQKPEEEEEELEPPLEEEEELDPLLLEEEPEEEEEEELEEEETQEGVPFRGPQLPRASQHSRIVPEQMEKPEGQVGILLLQHSLFPRASQ